MPAAMKMPGTMELLGSNVMWKCDTAASYHFAKSKDDACACNCNKVDVMPQGITHGYAEVLLLMDFMVRTRLRKELKGICLKLLRSDVMSPNTSSSSTSQGASEWMGYVWSKGICAAMSPCNTKSVTFDLVVKPPKGCGMQWCCKCTLKFLMQV